MRSIIDLGWEQSVVSLTSKIFHAGTVHDLMKFQDDFSKCFAQAVKKDTNHQKSPSFVASILNNAMLSTSNERQCQDLGGFTDLKHKGEGRKVCWSLIKAVIEALMTKYFPVHFSPIEDDKISMKFEANFYLWILEQRVITLSACSTIAISEIDIIMTMLGAIGQKCATMANDGYETRDFEIRCHNARQSLELAVSSRAREDAIKFCMPKISLAYRRENSDSEIMWRNPNIVLPATLQPKKVLNNLAMSRAAAKNNLSAHIPVFCNKVTPDIIRVWMRQVLSKSNSNSESQQLVLGRVDLWLIETLGTIDSIFLTANEHFLNSYVSELELLLDEYRFAHNKFVIFKSASAHMRVELRSKELLSMWIGFCITHAASKKLHPILEEYDVAIQWKEMRYMVFGSSLATDAALSVAAYLKRYSNHGKVVFSLLKQTETFNMACQFCENDPAIQKIWIQEQTEAARKESAHWIEVQRKQNLAKKLRLQIKALTAEIAQFNIEIGNKQSDRDSRKVSVPSHRRLPTLKYPGDDLDLQLEREICLIDSKINASFKTLNVAKRNLTAAETPPALILQPLPRGLTEAMKVLFFLHMPSAFQSLSKLSVVAQQMLIPRSFSIFQGNTG